MGKGIDYWFDLLLAVVMMALTVINMPVLATEWVRPLSSGIVDKTTIETDYSLYVEDKIKTGADLLMMMVVADEYTQYPRSIKINETPIIDLDDTWIANKSINISKIYNINGSYKLGGMLEYEITSTTFVENSNDPYWHFGLEDKK